MAELKSRSCAAKDPTSATMNRDSSTDAPATVKTTKSKDAGGLWIWPRRLSAARVFGFGLSRSQPSQTERVEIEIASPTGLATTGQLSIPRSPVDVVGMEVNPASNMPKHAVGDPSTGNSSQSSFTSLAPPVPPAPVPPLRRPRRPAQKTPMQRLDESDSADSTLTLDWFDLSTASRNQMSDRQAETGRVSLAHSDTVRSSNPGTVLSTFDASLAMEAVSTAATSVSPATSTPAKPTSMSASNETIIDHTARPGTGDFFMSPALTVSRRLSESSDAGTKEILLSDRESLAGPKMSSDSFIRGPIDEQHPDLQTFYPVGASLVRPARPIVSDVIPPLSPMTKEEAVSALPRRVGAVPDLSSPPTSSGRDESLGRAKSPRLQQSTLTEHGRSFRSVRSFRSTSDGSVRRYRPLPTIPGRSRGYSMDPTIDHRDASHEADSFVTADAHVRHGSTEQTRAGQRDGLPLHKDLPLRDAQISPPMLTGMVAGVSSPTQWSHSTPDQSGTGIERYGYRLSSASTVSVKSPVLGTRPLPSISDRSIDAISASAELHAKKANQRRSCNSSQNNSERPSLSPSAFYGDKTHFKHPTRSPAGPRASWSSADGPWSAAVTSSSILGAVRGMAAPETMVNDSEVLQRALSQPRDDAYRNTDIYSMSHVATKDEDQNAELTRLEKSRSSSGALPRPSKIENIELPDSLERAPFADTGVQASLAALRALESPGESLRTILARQRIFGEPDASVTEFLRESRILNQDDEDPLAMRGSRQSRRAAPYPRFRNACYSSEELSSSGRSLSGRRAEAVRGRHRRDETGMAEVSRASFVETSGHGSDSEGATLAAIRSVRNATADHLGSFACGAAGVEEVLSLRHLAAWEDLSGLRQPSRDPSAASSRPARANDLARDDQTNSAATSPIDAPLKGEHPQMPRHDRYVTALSHTSEQDTQRQVRDEQPRPAHRESPEILRETATNLQANTGLPASTMSPALLLRRERLASQVPSTVYKGSHIAFTPSAEMGSPLIQQLSMRSPSLPLELAFAGRRNSRNVDTPDTGTVASRIGNDADLMTRSILSKQQQRSRSDVHGSSIRNNIRNSIRNTKMSTHLPGRHETDKSRFDVQLEDLLLLREKVLQAGSPSRLDGLNASFDHSDTVSMSQDPLYSMDRSARRPRNSSISSKRRSRSSKLGYTMPDILAWQAGLDKSNEASTTIM
ncbi:uncharacterized protein MEPE_05919 [Melanopsichium pennsylvanicum]|uniref:Uncharacterized protein n=2 Tax=Melanopsichium pennsylvanicum TaxID=63383 RepID=A0AAJ5C874_9BASI|nr:hypothetical protein BN887_03775 [Melanopsichium pennsylvanicum 4]SNX87209.1 uncharacterized protein MEPE_05919 [Melanopsichium pennsylvanicum]